MEDWEEALLADWDNRGAITTAQEAAATPLTRAMLDLCSCDMELPFSGSPKAMARLLDIAILTANQKAAVNLSKNCQVWPLRRWSLDWEFKFRMCWEAVRTALLAGANFQDLMVKGSWELDEDIPFAQAVFLNSELEDWQELRHLLPQCHGHWRPRDLDNGLADFFLEGPHGPDDGWKLSLDKIRAAEDAGLDLQFLFVGCQENRSRLVVSATLLDMAIWCGQPSCAEACVDGGMELKGDDSTLAWHKRVLPGESLNIFATLSEIDFVIDVVPSEAQIAAAAAGRAWLKRCWKSESSQKGIVLYQFMLKMFVKGRSFPMALVQEILAYSMPVPKIIDQLDLWEHVGAWMATIWGRPASVHPGADCNTADVEEAEGMQDIGEAEDNGEAGTLLYIEILVLFFIVCF